LKSWYKKLKNALRTLANVKKEAIKIALLFKQKIDNEYNNLSVAQKNDKSMFEKLLYFKEMLTKHIDLLFRRLIKGETIPHSEKCVSIFEDYTEWICKGKQYPSVELGKNLMITTNEHHLIFDSKMSYKKAKRRKYSDLPHSRRLRFLHAKSSRCYT